MLLLTVRLLLALSAASFMPAASGYAVALGGPERRGRALSMVTNGLTLAIIAGVPLGALVGEGFGWRATFLGVAGLAALLAARDPRSAAAPTACAGAGQALRYAGGPGDQRADGGRHLHGLHLSRRLLPDVAGLGLQGLVLVLLGSSAWPVRSAPGSAAAAADRWGARYRRCRPMVHFSDRAGRPVMSARREIVLPKVFLSHRSQIFRAVRAAIES